MIKHNSARRLHSIGVMVLLGFACTFASCTRKEVAKEELSYPAPRFPHYLANPSEDALIRGARFAVRQPTGRCPLGKMTSGDEVYVLVWFRQEMNVWDVVQKAWAERGVKAHAIGYWDVLGMTKEEYDKKMEATAIYGNEAWKEPGIFIRQDYRKYFPKEVQEEFGPFEGPYDLIDPYVVRYLDQHPEIQHLYAGSGGGNFWERFLGPKHRDKFEGNWIYINAYDLLTKAAEFPADVWSLVDEKILQPVPFVSEVTFEDPEGTNLHWMLTPEESQYWSKNTGASNHIYIYPSPLHSTLNDGAVLVAHTNHTGVYPTMTVHVDAHGGVQRIDGGGRTGELFAMLVNNPLFKDAKFPTAPVLGYWFFRQDGFATNPKFIRNYQQLTEGYPWLANASERNRAGVQHLAFSYDSNDPRDLAYAKQRGIPLGEGQHNFHMHNYFPTAKWKLRDTGEWVTVSDKGYVRMFDDPEVRALASRYGDPELIFRYEWIPAMPGINVEGDYKKDFASDPWNWTLAEWRQIQSNVYEYFIEDYSLNE